jgi:hypothetical protein
VLQGSQVEVGISKKETENNAGSIESHKQAVEVKVKLELVTGSRESGQTGQTNKGILTEEKTHKLN